MEGPSCGSHCHPVVGTGAQFSESVTPGIRTQHHVPNMTARGWVIDVHHVAFCFSPVCCPGDLQHGGSGAAQGEAGRGQGVWKATGRQSALCVYPLLCPVVPHALAVPQAGLQHPDGTGWWAGWSPGTLSASSLRTNGQTGHTALSTMSPGLAAGHGRGGRTAFQMGSRDVLCVTGGVWALSRKVG